MWRNVVRLRQTFIIPILSHEGEHDRDMLNHKYPTGPETGLDRIKKMFQRNEFNEHSVELHTVIQTSLCGIFFGACMGGFVRSRNAYIYFIENNQATIYKSTMDAKKKLQDYVTVAFAKGAVQWGWRLGIFTGMFSLISTVIAVYRNESALADYIVAGAVTGGLYKANLGLIASVVGATLGAVLSTIAGIAILSILKTSNVSMDDIRKALYSIKEAREDQYNQALEKAATIKNDSLTKHHDVILQDVGEKTIEDLK